MSKVKLNQIATEAFQNEGGIIFHLIGFYYIQTHVMTVVIVRRSNR